MQSILIIGLGRFGRHLAMSLSELGNEVMIVDKEERPVSDLTPYVTAAQIGDCTDQWVIEGLGVSEFDLCFVCISNDLESSLVITMMLRENGARKVIAKVNQDLHARFLLSNGAEEVIYPEKDMAVRAAMKYSAPGTFDYLQLSPAYGIFEIAPPGPWIGKNLRDTDIRKKYQLNIIAEKVEDTIKPIDQETFVFSPGQHLLIAGEKKKFQKLIGR